MFWEHVKLNKRKTFETFWYLRIKEHFTHFRTKVIDYTRENNSLTGLGGWENLDVERLRTECGMNECVKSVCYWVG